MLKFAIHERPTVAANGVRAAVVCGNDLMGGAHHLGAAPGLVEADIADDIGRLKAAVAGGVGGRHSGGCAAATDREGIADPRAASANVAAMKREMSQFDARASPRTRLPRATIVSISTAYNSSRPQKWGVPLISRLCCFAVTTLERE